MTAGGDPDPRYRGELFAALAAMGFGSAYVATAVALRTFTPLSAALYRSLVALGALAILLVALRGRPDLLGWDPAAAPGRGSAGRRMRLLVIAGFGGPLFLASMNLAVAHVGATIAAFVAGLYAVLAAVLAPFLLAERLTERVFLGFVLALVGTALLAELDPTSTDLAGMAWGLAAALWFSMYLVLTRRWSRPYGLTGPTIAITTLGVSAVVLAAAVGVAEPTSLVPPADATAVAAIAWLALVAAGGQIFTVASVRLIPAARSAAFLLLNPITATVLAAVLLGERPSPAQLAGGLLVLGGIAGATLPVGMDRQRADPGGPFPDEPTREADPG
jgi:drug/metabolite transporter (DMT)-like permease